MWCDLYFSETEREKKHRHQKGSNACFCSNVLHLKVHRSVTSPLLPLSASVSRGRETVGPGPGSNITNIHARTHYPIIQFFILTFHRFVSHLLSQFPCLVAISPCLAKLELTALRAILGRSWEANIFLFVRVKGVGELWAGLSLAPLHTGKSKTGHGHSGHVWGFVDALWSWTSGISVCGHVRWCDAGALLCASTPVSRMRTQRAAACGRSCGVLGATSVALRAHTTQSNIHLLGCVCCGQHGSCGAFVWLGVLVCVCVCVWGGSFPRSGSRGRWRGGALRPIPWFLPSRREPRTHTHAPFYWLPRHDGTNMWSDRCFGDLSSSTLHQLLYVNTSRKGTSQNELSRL